jgi:peptide subunit release factor 1 (eRF1)
MLFGDVFSRVFLTPGVRCRLSVLGAITSTQQKLKLYTRVPDNGLVIYCGTILTDDGKEKRVNIDFEPFKPINTSLYLCDNKFHTEVSTHLLPPFHYRLMLIPSSHLNSY